MAVSPFIGTLTPAAHKALRDLIHFIDDGPADGFASGAWKEVLPLADPFPTSVIWYDSAAPGHKKIVEKTTVYSGPFPVTEVWKMYDVAEVLLVTVTDTIVNSGPFEASRTRVVT